MRKAVILVLIVSIMRYDQVEKVEGGCCVSKPPNPERLLSSSGSQPALSPPTLSPWAPVQSSPRRLGGDDPPAHPAPAHV
ncbi:hypothetical protein DCAR_0311957 [Daucus carota subsp. sativus]|uniref:Uncharacterized protein n=1 Tax=Daucus carota subsp. sativus TaxID=79200 RepID=A0A162AJC5_DAUCS|nr:hypothetical protein DCAR_0311957 [Daucus carota subsp. sativus]